MGVRLIAVTVFVFVAVLFAPLFFRESCTYVDSKDSIVVESHCLLELDIDARDMSRGLLHAEIRIPLIALNDVFQELADNQSAATGSLVTHAVYKVWFPKWIPGIHAPRGAIQNMAGFFCEDEHGNEHGNVLVWERDPHDAHAFLCTVPVSFSSKILKLRFDYICNQPSTNSRGVDSFGDYTHGIISLNNVLMYPDGFKDSQIQIHARIQLPPGWQMATALTILPSVTTVDLEPSAEPGSEGVSPDDARWIEFADCDIRQCIDSPIIAGKYFKTYPLSDCGREVRLHCVGDTSLSVLAGDDFLQSMKNMVIESRILFGEEHYRAYDFLLVCSDGFPRMGLEHLESSLNGVSSNDLSRGAGGAMRVMSHEYMHSWCGKHRRPHGMHTENFHDPKATTLLWVYEGLTQYLGKVVAVRSGMKNEDQFRSMIHSYAQVLRNTNGRRWRSLADTATASYLLRGGSHHWSNWLRGQDYYIEGAMIWLEADCIMRQRSEGAVSLDDFARIFLGNKLSELTIDSYVYDDVVKIMNTLVPYNWNDFFEQRVYQPQEKFRLDFLDVSGWTIDIVDVPVGDTREKNYSYRKAYESIGMGMNGRGGVYRVLKDSPAYKAGLARGMQILRINELDISPAVLHQALKQSLTRGALHFAVTNEDGFQDCIVEYSGGPKYLALQRIEGEGHKDWIREICRSRIDEIDEGVDGTDSATTEMSGSKAINNAQEKTEKELE